MRRHEKYYEMLADILNEFDFEKVRKAMLHLEWGWVGEGVPSINKLRYSSRDRIDSAIKGCLSYGRSGEPFFSSSGGLKATVIKNEYGQINYIQLEFILTEWNSTDEDL